MTEYIMFTDGYVDQFNVDNQRYSKRQLREKLLKINRLPFNNQQKILEEEFKTWQSTQEQIDDVLVMGFRWNPN